MAKEPGMAKKQGAAEALAHGAGALAQGAVDTVGRVGRALGSALHPKPFWTPRARRPRSAPGSAPGLDRAAGVDSRPAEGTVGIRCIDYGPAVVETRSVDDLDAFLAAERPSGAATRWINVDGLHPFTINRLRSKFPFHTLAGEDIVHVGQRAKVEPYDDHIFLVFRMLLLREGRLHDEQVSVVVFRDSVLTFQETAGDVWDPIRKRIENPASRLRAGGPAYLVYALLDAIVDHFFPVLEHYGDRLEAVEQAIVERPSDEHLRELYNVKRELVTLRRMMWPMRQVADDLYRSEHELVDDHVRNYLRDVYDHSIQVIEMIETYREMAGGLTDLYMSSISNRMNEVMKVLTIMASLFIPITFIAGVYGMNFEHIPELGFKYSYAVFWVACISVTAALLFYFRRKGWIGGG